MRAEAGDPRPAAARPRARQRKRLRGWLLAAGMTDAAAAGRLVTKLLDGDEAAGVAAWIERLDGWLQAEAGPALRDAGPALARLAEDDDPAARLAERAETKPAADDRIPLLPETRPREMERQPLGRLPAVLRGGAWVLANRWSLPNRIGPRISRSLWSWRSTGEEAPAAPAEEPAAHA